MAHISNVLPAVAETTDRDGTFVWPPVGSISGPDWLAHYLACELQATCGLLALSVAGDSSVENVATVQLTLGTLPHELPSLTPSTRKEAHEIAVRAAGIEVLAESEGGLFYGSQSLLQLLSACGKSSKQGARRVHCCTCLDYPRYEWCAPLALVEH